MISWGHSKDVERAIEANRSDDEFTLAKERLLTEPWAALADQLLSNAAALISFTDFDRELDELEVEAERSRIEEAARDERIAASFTPQALRERAERDRENEKWLAHAMQ